MVMFPYRPEYYDIKQDEDGNSLEGVTELILAKFRHGEIGSVKMKLNKATGTFEQLDDDGETTAPKDYNFGLLAEKKYEAPIDHFDDIEEAPAPTSKNPFDSLPFLKYFKTFYLYFA